MVRLETKVPDPDPSVVLVESEMVGVEFVDHTTPLFVMDAPPSDVIFPPDLAEMEVISVP